jgi:hypothetical protein
MGTSTSGTASMTTSAVSPGSSGSDVTLGSAGATPFLQVHRVSICQRWVGPLA